MVTDIAGMYAEHHRRVWVALYVRTGDRWLADDLTQETFLRALTASYAEQGTPLAWLLTIAQNLLLDHVKSAHVQRCEPLLDVDRQPGGSPAAEVLALRSMWLAETSAVLHEAVDELVPTQRRVMTLRYWRDLSIRATAHATGMEIGAVKAATFRAVRALRRDRRVAALVGAP